MFKIISTSVFAFVFMTGFVTPVSADTTRDCNYKHNDMSFEECASGMLSVSHETKQPIAYVAYDAPSCRYSILKEYATDAFVIVRTIDDLKMTNGLEIFNYDRNGWSTESFNRSTAYGLVGVERVKMRVLAKDAHIPTIVDEYMRLCRF